MKHRNIPVSMICVSNESGIIEPVKFQISQKDSSLAVYRIGAIKHREDKYIAGCRSTLFYTSVCINQMDYNVVFKFVHNSCLWTCIRCDKE